MENMPNCMLVTEVKKVFASVIQARVMGVPMGQRFCHQSGREKRSRQDFTTILRSFSLRVFLVGSKRSMNIAYESICWIYESKPINKTCTTWARITEVKNVYIWAIQHPTNAFWSKIGLRSQCRMPNRTISALKQVFFVFTEASPN